MSKSERQRVSRVAQAASSVTGIRSAWILCAASSARVPLCRPSATLLASRATSPTF